MTRLANSPVRTRWAALCLAISVPFSLLSACGVNQAPSIDPVASQLAAVGNELTIPLHTSDANADSLSIQFSCADLPMLMDRTPAPSVERVNDGMALFRWIPRAGDARAEAYPFDFNITDGKTWTQQTVFITVADQSTSGAPAFVQPVGSGTTLQADVQACIDLAIVVSDTDSTQTTIAQEPPLVAGATLKQTGAFTARWHWCPTAAQTQVQDRFYLFLSASDGEHVKTLKPGYLIVVLGSNVGANCPGAAPVITHTPIGAQTGAADIAIPFDASDDVGIYATPTVYWSTQQPITPPDVTTMTALASKLVSGNAPFGSYSATVPNPTAGAASGTTKTVYYVISTRDNDDPTGSCNHRTLNPVDTSYSFTVTNTGAGLAMCQACTTDAQCGGAADNCIVIGQTLRCAKSCGGGCGTGTVCSTYPIHSVDGVDANQCLPVSGACQ